MTLKKAICMIIILDLALIFALQSNPAHAHDYGIKSIDEIAPVEKEFSFLKGGYFEVTYFAKAFHRTKNDLNENNAYFGITYRDDNYGVGAATFVNSYYDRSLMVYVTKYWQLTKNYEAYFSMGYVTGYASDPIFAPYFGLSFTRYDNFVPSISIFGDATVLSLSFKF